MWLSKACCIGLLMPLASETAFACSCAGSRLACEAFGQSEAVFVGKVAASREEAYNLQGGQAIRRRVTFDVIENFRGTREPKVNLVTGIGGGDCGYPFRLGEMYLVYAYRNDDSGTLESNICTLTA